MRWEKEPADLTAEKYTLCDEYYRLNDELRNVEALRRGAENIIRVNVQRTQPGHRQEVEL